MPKYQKNKSLRPKEKSIPALTRTSPWNKQRVNQTAPPRLLLQWGKTWAKCDFLRDTITNVIRQGALHSHPYSGCISPPTLKRCLCCFSPQSSDLYHRWKCRRSLTLFFKPIHDSSAEHPCTINYSNKFKRKKLSTKTAHLVFWLPALLLVVSEDWTNTWVGLLSLIWEWYWFTKVNTKKKSMDFSHF